MPKSTHKAAREKIVPLSILLTAKALGIVSKPLLVKFAAKLFSTPIKHPVPKREIEMETKTTQSFVKIPAIGKEVCVYEYGKSDKKVLLVHGWSGRGTQLFKIADALLQNGYSTVSFDAPAHGKSLGKTTLMPEFVATIFELERQFGPFESAIGHSLGGMSLLNAVRDGLGITNLVTIGSGDVIDDIVKEFLSKLQIDSSLITPLKNHFEKQTHQTMDSFSAYIAAQSISIPVLVIHDHDDTEVPVTAAKNIAQNLKQGTLILTEGLGHRKILGDSEVIQTILKFIKNKKDENENDVIARGIIPNSLSGSN